MIIADPLVSVVLPVRNGERYLAEAIESVLAQTHRRLELLVVDGGSTDRSAEIARGYERVTWIAQTGKGLPAAWNQGIAAARGDLVGFISADDRWTVDKLGRQVDGLLRDPKLVYAVAWFRFFLEPGCALPRGFDAGLLERDLLGRIPETLLARRTAFATVGPFDTSYAAAQDVDWFVRAQELETPMTAIPRVLLHKRVHDRNLSSNAAVNTPALLQVLHRSLRRRRSGPGADDRGHPDGRG